MNGILKRIAFTIGLLASAIGSAQADNLRADSLLAVDRNRGAVIEQIITQFKGGFAAGQEVMVRETLKSLRADHLLAASLAPNLQGLLAAMNSADTGIAALPITPATLGDPTSDLVYTPVTPCRLFDTRPSQGGLGALLPGVTRTYGATAPVPQQGGPGGCTAPAGTAVAFIQIAALNPTGPGLIQGGASGSGPFLNALVLYQPGGLDGSGVPMPVNVANGRFDLVAQFSGVEAAGDLLGYFKPPANLVEQLWAVVDANGTLSRGHRAVSVSHTAATHSYVVTFDRNVRNCVYSATIGLSGASGTSPPGFMTVVGAAVDVNAVFLTTDDIAGGITERGFHLLVNC